jgi:hypothetical protein
MDEDRGWNRIVDAIDTKFGIDKHGKSERKVEDAMHLTEKVSYIEFERTGQPYRLERITGPAIIDRRTVGARRAGSTIKFENVYDPTEVGHKTIVFKKINGEWEKISAEELGIG